MYTYIYIYITYIYIYISCIDIYIYIYDIYIYIYAIYIYIYILYTCVYKIDTHVKTMHLRLLLILSYAIFSHMTFWVVRKRNKFQGRKD